MRFEKGSLQINDARDVPLLQHVLRAGYITSNQLFEFMCVEQRENRRQAFDNRLRRLIRHRLIERIREPVRGRSQICRITPDGASVLIDYGELFAGSCGIDNNRGSCVHWLDLNDLHLALMKARVLTRWIPATEICSQNDLTEFRYAKDYDAVGVLDCEGRSLRFGIEYERIPKTEARYRAIANALEYEQLVDAVLYLVSNYHMLCKVRDLVNPDAVPVCIAMFPDFVKTLLRTPVTVAGGRQRDVPFHNVLLEAHQKRSRRSGGRPLGVTLPAL